MINAITAYGPNLLILGLIGLAVAALLKRLTRNSSYARVMFFIHLCFVTTIGWGLVFASATFNAVYTYSLLRGMPGYEDMALIGSAFSVAVNLAGGLALQAAARSYSKNKKFKATGYAIGYLPIVAYSLLAANSVLLTGDANTRQQADAAVAQQAAGQARINAVNADTQALTSGATNIAMQSVPKYMHNSNGARVSVASHCRPGGWYAKNQPACRAYLDAKRNSGAATQVAANAHKIADIQSSIAASKANAPVPLQSSFFGNSIAPAIATLALALAMELAAIVSLTYAALDIGNPPPVPYRKKKTAPVSKQPVAGSKDRKTRSDEIAGPSRSAGPANADGVVDSVKTGLGTNTDSAAQSYYLGGKVAANRVFNGQRVKSVTEDQLHGFLYELAKANPHKPVVANQVILELKLQAGAGVGKQRMLDVIKDSAEFVLTKNNGGSNTYIFKVVNDETTSTDNLVQTVRAAQGAGPLRAGAGSHA